MALNAIYCTLKNNKHLHDTFLEEETEKLKIEPARHKLRILDFSGV